MKIEESNTLITGPKNSKKLNLTKINNKVLPINIVNTKNDSIIKKKEYEILKNIYGPDNLTNLKIMYRPMDFLRKNHFIKELSKNDPVLQLNSEPYSINYELALDSELNLIKSTKPSRFESFRKNASIKTRFQKKKSEKEFADKLVSLSHYVRRGTESIEDESQSVGQLEDSINTKIDKTIITEIGSMKNGFPLAKEKYNMLKNYIDQNDIKGNKSKFKDFMGKQGIADNNLNPDMNLTTSGFMPYETRQTYFMSDAKSLDGKSKNHGRKMRQTFNTKGTGFSCNSAMQPEPKIEVNNDHWSKTKNTLEKNTFDVKDVVTTQPKSYLFKKSQEQKQRLKHGLGHLENIRKERFKRIINRKEKLDQLLRYDDTSLEGLTNSVLNNNSLRMNQTMCNFNKGNIKNSLKQSVLINQWKDNDTMNRSFNDINKSAYSFHKNRAVSHKVRKLHSININNKDISKKNISVKRHSLLKDQDLDVEDFQKTHNNKDETIDTLNLGTDMLHFQRDPNFKKLALLFKKQEKTSDHSQQNINNKTGNLLESNLKTTESQDNAKLSKDNTGATSILQNLFQSKNIFNIQKTVSEQANTKSSELNLNTKQTAFSQMINKKPQSTMLNEVLEKEIIDILKSYKQEINYKNLFQQDTDENKIDRSINKAPDFYLNLIAKNKSVNKTVTNDFMTTKEKGSLNGRIISDVQLHQAKKDQRFVTMGLLKRRVFLEKEVNSEIIEHGWNMEKKVWNKVGTVSKYNYDTSLASICSIGSPSRVNRSKFEGIKLKEFL